MLFIVEWFHVRLFWTWPLNQRCICVEVVFSASCRCLQGRLPKVGWCIQYIPRNMHTVFALLCFVVVIHWLIFPYPSGLLHWHSGNLTIAPVPAKQSWWIWINTSCEFIMNDCITTTKQSTTKPCAYFLGYTVYGTINKAIIGSVNGSRKFGSKSPFEAYGGYWCIQFHTKIVY